MFKNINQVRTLALSDLRTIYAPKTKGRVTNLDMQKAVTVAAELEHYRIAVRPEDIVKMAYSDTEAIMKNVQDTFSGPKALPMYPNFPEDVLSMDEATFRFDQIRHYFSTYGVELLAKAFEMEDYQVQKGWLPYGEEAKARDVAVEKNLEIWTEDSLNKALANKNLAVYSTITKGEDGITVKFEGPEDCFGNKKTIRCWMDENAKTVDSAMESIENSLKNKQIGFNDYNFSESYKTWANEIISAIEETNAQHRKTLLPLQTYDISNDKELTEKVIKMLGKKQGLTPGEIQLSVDCMEDVLSGESIEVPFKANIGKILKEEMKEEKNLASHFLIQSSKHPGDILDALKAITDEEHQRLKTSEKKVFVRSMDVFPSDSIKENLTIDKAARIQLLQNISYTSLSKNPENVQAVNDVRAGKVKSWNSKLEKAFEGKDSQKVLELFAERPGVGIRSLTRACDAGISKEDAFSAISHTGKFENYQHSELKVQTLVNLYNQFSKEEVSGMHYVNDSFGNGYHREAVEIPAYKAEYVKEISEKLLQESLNRTVTPLYGKKVYVETGEFDLNNSNISIDNKRESDGYVAPELAYKIPEEAKNLRFFVYWNDKDRVDVDLHTYGVKEDGTDVHVGWNSDYKTDGIVTSGDITHSNAAEYIDINLAEAKKRGVKKLCSEIEYYNGEKLSEIEECFTGTLAFSDSKEVEAGSFKKSGDIWIKGEMKDPEGARKLYCGENVMMRNDLTTIDRKGTTTAMIDLNKGIIKVMDRSENPELLVRESDGGLSVNKYIDMLLSSQKCEEVLDKKDADIVIRLDKGDKEDISLIDNNFFMDSKQLPKNEYSAKMKNLEVKTEKNNESREK